MKIASILENQNIEKRIAITPDIAKKYTINTSELNLLNEQINKLTNEHFN